MVAVVRVDFEDTDMACYNMPTRAATCLLKARQESCGRCAWAPVMMGVDEEEKGWLTHCKCTPGRLEHTWRAFSRGL